MNWIKVKSHKRPNDPPNSVTDQKGKKKPFNLHLYKNDTSKQTAGKETRLLLKTPLFLKLNTPIHKAISNIYRCLIFANTGVNLFNSILKVGLVHFEGAK